MPVFTLFILCACDQSMSEQELARRIAASQPTWQNYQEDIKAQIGATPVAEWEGAPQRAWVEGKQLFVSFQLNGPWTTRSFAIPILVQTPTGDILQSKTAALSDPSLIYRFDLPTETTPAWVQIKYPNGESRLIPS